MLLLRLVMFSIIALPFREAYREGKYAAYPLVVDYNENYYYKTLREKMIESLSISNCSMNGDVMLYQDQSSTTSVGAELTVRVIKPPQLVVQKWGADSRLKQSKRIFALVSDSVCRSKKFSNVLKGVYKRAKGCYAVYAKDKQGLRYKRFNDYGATLHPEHIRCKNDIVKASNLCKSDKRSPASSNGMQVIDQKLRSLHHYPFLVTAQRVVVGKGGMFAMPCGPFGLFGSCEAVKWGVPMAHRVVADVQLCRDSVSHCPHTRKAKVFIMTQYDDTQIGQYMQEALPKLMYHLDFLRSNPDVFIHYGFTKKPTLPAFVLPHWFFRFLGLEHRLINGTVFADQVYMPREGGCQDVGYNAWEVVVLRERFLQLLQVDEDKAFESRAADKPTLLIVSRSAGPYVQNKADSSRRKWPKDKFPLMVAALQENFPGHRIHMFSDLNATLMTCPLCQAEAFHRADIVIGMHGAGLSNAIFMRPGGVIIEVIYDFDARHAPIIGIFPRLSSIIGLHHYTVSIGEGSGGLDVVQLANDSAQFVHQARLWEPVDVH